MQEIKITDVLDRPLNPGNIVVLNTLTTGGHVFDGIWTIRGVEYRNNGKSWAVELVRYKGLRGPSRFVTGDWFEGSCFGHGNLICKLAEHEITL